MADYRSGSRSRIVVNTSRQTGRGPARRAPASRSPEIWVALSVIGAATLATFLALYLTSRPYDPMSTRLNAQQTVPAGPSLSPTPKPSVSATPTPVASVSAPSPETSEAQPAIVDDTTIQSGIEKALAADTATAGADVSTLVENGRVTIVGSVKSAEMKQRIERIIRSVKGVTSIDDQLVVSAPSP